ncbi:MAG TPA: DUF4388 domain-containing protein [Planctomycetota bacterium]|nr:DUF4388 domain-containing protein [Planctomycetota bacterium]
MLNRDLVEQFQRIASEAKTGVLAVHFAANHLRFWFESGELQLLDLGENKEHLMARKFLDYHMIGPEIHRHVLDVCKKTGVSPVDILRRQSLVSDGEIEQIARTLVEDLLCASFGSKHHELKFDPAATAETFDLESSAVRLRIQTEVLLQMVEARASEEERVIQETGGWDAVFVLEEAAEGGDDLDDYEKTVLGYVDGKRTLEDIAKLLRTSSMHMARTLVSLAAKGYARRGTGLASSRRAAQRGGSAKTPTSGSPVAADDAAGAGTGSSSSQRRTLAGAPPAPEAQAPTFILTPAPAASGRGFMVVGGVVLVALLGLWLLVQSSSSQREAMVGLSDQIAADLGSGDLNRADTRLSEARVQAAGDLAALAEVDALTRRVNEAIERQVANVAAQVEAGEVAAAREAFDRLPTARVPADLGARLVRAERERDARAQALARQVERLLDENRIDQALAAMDEADARETPAAREVLDRWRVLGLEQASLSGTAPARREVLIAALKQSRPSPLQQEQIDRIAKDLERTFGRNRAQLRDLQAQLAQGAWQEAKAEAERLRLIDDTASGPEVTAFMAELGRVGGELETIYSDACAAVRDAVDGQAFPAVRTRIENALTAYPQASNRAALTALAQSLEVIEPALGRGTLAEEAGQFRAWVADSQVDPGVAAAIAARVQRLSQADADARAALEYTRRLASDGKWSEAIEALESLRTRSDWRRASAWTAAAEDLVAARANLARAAGNQRRFEAALAKGDVASAHEIARELGMRTLPLWVESIPVGAQVSRDGAVIGVTPMMVEISGAERGELVLGISAPGYEDRQVSGGDAQQGWRLAVELVRSAKAQCDARMIVSGKPAAAGGQLWLVGPSQVARVALDGQVSAFPLEGTAFNSGAGARRLSEPVYAPATALDDGVYVATRDMIALRVDGRAVSRLSLATRSDHALAAYSSAIVDNRRWLIAAGTDGAVHGNDPQVADAVWHGPTGAAFACGPVVVGDTVLVARVDGVLQALDADNGRVADATSCGETTLAAWAEGDGMAGIGRTRSWRWNAEGVVSEPLPKEAVIASRGIFITADRHAWVAGDGGWKDVGQLPAQPTAAPCAWRGDAAVPIGRDLHVVGAHGFVVHRGADMLSPVEVDGHLAVVSADGQVSLYAP